MIELKDAAEILKAAKKSRKKIHIIVKKYLSVKTALNITG